MSPGRSPVSEAHRSALFDQDVARRGVGEYHVVDNYLCAGRHDWLLGVWHGPETVGRGGGFANAEHLHAPRLTLGLADLSPEVERVDRPSFAVAVGRLFCVGGRSSGLCLRFLRGGGIRLAASGKQKGREDCGPGFQRSYQCVTFESSSSRRGRVALSLTTTVGCSETGSEDRYDACSETDNGDSREADPHPDASASRAAQDCQHDCEHQHDPERQHEQ